MSDEGDDLSQKEQLLAGRWRRRGVVTDVAGYASGQVSTLVLAAVVGIFVARYLGPEALGLLSFAGAIYGLLIPVALLGMQQVFIREFATSDGWHENLASALGFQLTAALVMSSLGFVIVTTGACETTHIMPPSRI